MSTPMPLVVGTTLRLQGQYTRSFVNVPQMNSILSLTRPSLGVHKTFRAVLLLLLRVANISEEHSTKLKIVLPMTMNCFPIGRWQNGECDQFKEPLATYECH